MNAVRAKIRAGSCLLVVALFLLTIVVPASARQKPRLLVTTDIGGDPDDEESMVRLLVYSNEFDIEGLIAVASDHAPRENLIRRQIAAYAQVRPNLLKQAAGFPDPDALLAATCSGQPAPGMKGVGPDKSTPGSQQIIAAADRDDPRSLWIMAWGGTATIAQALSDVRASRSSAEVDKFVAKLHVYSISDQDDSGPWIRREFPKLFYIVSPSRPAPDWFEYYRATWAGISGDRFFKVGVSSHFDMVDNPWLNEHIIENHGPLGALYPPVKFIMEGDTPSYLGLIDNGLGSDVSPDYGGWGGRYQLYHASTETHAIWTNNMHSRDTMTADDNGRTETSDQATIWRWREAFQNDFAARMNWCIADSYAKANHNPLAVLNGDRSTDVIFLTGKGGSQLRLSAAETSDPDGDHVKLTWWIYPEAGNIDGETLTKSDGPETDLNLPIVKKRGGRVHVILQAQDDGAPHLFAYRRAVVEVDPSPPATSSLK